MQRTKGFTVCDLLGRPRLRSLPGTSARPWPLISKSVMLPSAMPDLNLKFGVPLLTLVLVGAGCSADGNEVQAGAARLDSLRVSYQVWRTSGPCGRDGREDYGLADLDSSDVRSVLGPPDVMRVEADPVYHRSLPQPEGPVTNWLYELPYYSGGVPVDSVEACTLTVGFLPGRTVAGTVCE